MIERIWLMSIYATVLIVLVLGIRYLLAKYSKIYCYCLWILVMIRLLCPIFITSELSVHNYVYDTVNEADVIKEALSGHSTADRTSDSRKAVVSTTSNHLSWSRAIEILKMVWLLGVVLVSGIFFAQYIGVRRKMQTAIKEGDDIWLSDRIESPFVFGLCHPRIYLPYGLQGKEREYIVRHETMHIRHRDAWIRGLGTLAICLHWWNPMVWYCIYKVNQDMEMFCDETVLQDATNEERKEYANILLMHAIKKSQLSCIMAFGETNTERRIRHISRGKKKSHHVTIMTAVSMIVLAVFFGTIPKEKAQGSSIQTKYLENSIEFYGGNDEFEKIVDSPSKEAKAFLSEFFIAVSKGQKEKVASMISYPRKLDTGSEILTIQNTDDFVKYYDLLITRGFKDKLSKWLESEINYNYLGMYLSDGEIWMILGEDGWFIDSIDNAEGISMRYDF